METITSTHYLNWGKLVKTWATGVSYFDKDFPPITIDRATHPALDRGTQGPDATGGRWAARSS